MILENRKRTDKSLRRINQSFNQAKSCYLIFVFLLTTLIRMIVDCGNGVTGKTKSSTNSRSNCSRSCEGAKTCKWATYFESVCSLYENDLKTCKKISTIQPRGTLVPFLRISRPIFAESGRAASGRSVELE